MTDASPNSDVNLDFARRERIGFDEAVLCAQKSPDQIRRILLVAADRSMPLLLTRLAAEKAATLADIPDLDYDPVSGTAFFRGRAHIRKTRTEEAVAIVAAGTSDAGVAREAARVLAFNAITVTEITDVGVAGLWRLTERLEDIRAHDIVIAVAGMDAALPSVLGGLIDAPLIAVPTSTGYGAARAGETALASCLVSCAPGVVVTNIDNGYGAACAALRIMNRFNR